MLEVQYEDPCLRRQIEGHVADLHAGWCAVSGRTLRLIERTPPENERAGLQVDLGVAPEAKRGSLEEGRWLENGVV